MELFEQFALGIAWVYWAMFHIFAALGFVVSHLGFGGTALAIVGISVAGRLLSAKLK